jgi:electron transport complex protein RnfC
MIASKPKPIEEILGYLEGEKKVAIIACTGCPEGCQSGDAEALAALKSGLEAGGKQVVGIVPVDFLCNKSLIARRLMAHLDEVNAADSLLVSSCGIGAQAVAATVDKLTHPVLNTISLGGFQGLWPGGERCIECGECVLHYTGGICPRTACSKSLIYGQCGGTSSEGKCEVDPSIPCGWYEIYKRLEKLGRLDLHLQPIAPPDYHKLFGDVKLRPTSWWALENES